MFLPSPQSETRSRTFRRRALIRRRGRTTSYVPYLDFAERCFKQICGFGEYGFPESHAASFAKLVYVSARLKRYHLATFAAAVLNSQPMGFYAPAELLRDAREHGVEVRPIDVNASDWDCTLEHDAVSTQEPTSDKVTWGCCEPALRQIKGLRREDADRIVAARKRAGPLTSPA